VRHILLLTLALSVIPLILSAQPTVHDGDRGERREQTYRLTGARVAFAQDVRIGSDEAITDGVAVFGGSLRVDGRVGDGILVVRGDVHLGPTADVRGDIVIVGGSLIRDPESRLAGAVSSLSLGDWSRRTGLLGWRPNLGLGDTGRWLGLAATVFRVAAIAAFMILILMVARAPVARVGRAAAAEPVRAAIIGLAAEVLFLPIVLIGSIALGITIIGLPFVFLLLPLAFALALVAFLLGYTALACRLGEWLEDRLGWRPRSAFMTTAMGGLLIIAPTLLARVLGVAPEPARVAAFGVLILGVCLEFVIWTIGLGVALMTGFGRWNTSPPPLDASR
jgi:hypothetical protein